MLCPLSYRDEPMVRCAWRRGQRIYVAATVSALGATASPQPEVLLNEFKVMRRHEGIAQALRRQSGTVIFSHCGSATVTDGLDDLRGVARKRVDFITLRL